VDTEVSPVPAVYTFQVEVIFTLKTEQKARPKSLCTRLHSKVNIDWTTEKKHELVTLK